MRELKARNLILALANPSKEITRLLAKSGVADAVGRERIFVRTHDAVAALAGEISGVAAGGGSLGGGTKPV